MMYHCACSIRWSTSETVCTRLLRIYTCIRLRVSCTHVLVSPDLASCVSNSVREASLRSFCRTHSRGTPYSKTSPFINQFHSRRRRCSPILSLLSLFFFSFSLLVSTTVRTRHPSAVSNENRVSLPLFPRSFRIISRSEHARLTFEECRSARHLTISPTPPVYGSLTIDREQQALG